jgi:uncharacterized protein
MATEYTITSEIFVVPSDGFLILYAPLKGVVASVNHSAAALLRDLSLGRPRTTSPQEETVLKSLAKMGIVNGPPDMELTVHEHKQFAPTCVSLYLTDACNLRCPYCYAHGGSNPNPVRIDLAAAKAGIDYVASNAIRDDANGFVVNFHGAGEPTLAWKELTSLVEYAKTRAATLGSRVSITTCTNGVLSPEHARWLAENTDAAAVSLDGLPQDHDLLRPKPDGSGSFADVARTLGIFDESDMLYSIRATITDSNVHTMCEMVRFFNDSFNAAELQFDPVLLTGRCHETGCRPAGEDVYAEEFMRASDIAEKSGCKLGFSVLSFTALRTFYCCSVSEGFAVTHNGEVTACFESCSRDHPFADLFVYGRFDPSTGAFQIDHDKLARLRRRHVHSLSLCRNCFCKYVCAGDCPMNSLRLGKALEEGGGRCALTQSIALYRLGKLVAPPSAHVSRPFLSDAPADFSLQGFEGTPTAEPPMLHVLRQLRVHECNYMRPPPPEQAARELISAGNASYRQRDFGRALRRYDKALEAQPGNPDARNNRGLCLHKLGQCRQAIEDFAAAIRSNPRIPSYHLNMGKVRLADGDAPGAIEAFDTALQLDPSYAEAQYNKGWALLDLGMVAEALGVLSHVSEDSECASAADALRTVAAPSPASNPKGETTGEPLVGVSEHDWILRLNRDILNGGLDDMPEATRAEFSLALRDLSVEQFAQARSRFASVVDMCPHSPLPHLAAAMACLGDNREDEADREMALYEGLLSTAHAAREALGTR